MLYANLASLSQASRVTSRNASRRLRLVPQRKSRRRIDKRKRDAPSPISTLSENRGFRGKKVNQQRTQANPESSATGPLTSDDLSSITTSSMVNPNEAGAQEENLAITTSDIDSLQRLLLQVEPQLVFWACREVQDFNSCFPGFETVSTNVLYIEREDELDIDQSDLYPRLRYPGLLTWITELQYPTKTVQDDELDILSLEDSIPAYHYLRSYAEVHELPIKLTIEII